MACVLKEPKAKKRKIINFNILLNKLPIDIKIKIINYRILSNYKCSTLEAHNGAVNCILIHNDCIISAGNDKMIKVWDFKNKKLKKVLKGHLTSILCLKSYKKYIISSSLSNIIMIWDLNKSLYIRKINVSNEYLLYEKTLKFSIIGENIISIFQGRRRNANGWIERLKNFTQFWNINTGETKRFIRSTQEENKLYYIHTIITFGNNFIVFPNCSLIEIWDIKINQQIKLLQGHTEDIFTLNIKENLLISGSKDNTIKLWNLKTCQCLKTYNGHTDSVNSVIFHKKFIVSGSKDKTIKLWNINTTECLKTFLNGHSFDVTCILSYKDNIISASYDNTIKIWEEEKEIDTYKRFLKIKIPKV